MNFRGDHRGVSDVIGSVLLVGITVAMMAGLSILVLSIDGPVDEVHADMTFQAFPGADGWNTGDETVRLTHQGGESIPAATLAIVVAIESNAYTFGPADFDGDFADGELTIGETWSTTFTIHQNHTVKATAIHDSNAVLFLATIRSPPSSVSCAGDTSPPSVQVWQQTPNDVTHLTNGSVTVTATLGDDCSGPNDAIVPSLEHRIGNGTWTDGGPMALTGGSQWTGSIPDPTWGAHSGELLEYRIVNMTDVSANVGTSTVRSDLIAAVDPIQYVQSFVEHAGSVVDFPNAQSASDGNAEAVLSESSGVITLLGTTATGSGASNPSNAAGNPDGSHATLPGSNDKVTVSGFDTAGLSGGITKVEMVFVGHYTGIRINDDLDLLADAGSGFITVDSAHVPPLLFDGTHRVDITSLDASWTWNDVAAVELRANYDRNNGDDGIDFLIDAMFLEVTTAASNDLDLEFHFPTLVAGTTHTLEIDYSVADDTFAVEVWDGSAWNARGDAMTATSTTSWSYQLTAQEASIDPVIRFVDASAADPAGSLMIEHARVVTA